MKRATLLALYLVAVAVCCLAQDRALISGDAEDKQDSPVPGVQVTLRNESLGIKRSTTTNADGLYFFAEVVPAEGYLIEASSPGMSFAPQRVKFDVEVGETRHVLPSFVCEKAQSLNSSPQVLVRPTAIIGLYRLYARRAIDPLSISWVAGSEMVLPAMISAVRRSNPLR